MKKALVVFIVLIMGCSGKIKPVDIYPEDICSFCKMAISQKEFAAEIITPDGEVFKFDDIGCMINFKRERDVPDGSVIYVSDFYTQEWLNFDDAFFAFSKKIQTPMNYGVVALKSKDEVLKFKNEYGGVELSKSELENRIKPPR